MTAQQQKQLNLNILKKCRLSFWLSLILVLTLSLAKLILINRSATWGRHLEQIKQETEEVRAENDQLKLELNRQIGGLDKAQEKAKELGFVDKPQYLYLNGGESVAQKLP